MFETSGFTGSGWEVVLPMHFVRCDWRRSKTGPDLTGGHRDTVFYQSIFNIPQQLAAFLFGNIIDDVMSRDQSSYM